MLLDKLSEHDKNAPRNTAQRSLWESVLIQPTLRKEGQNK
jgi:hypothetical protein